MIITVCSAEDDYIIIGLFEYLESIELVGINEVRYIILDYFDLA